MRYRWNINIIKHGGIPERIQGRNPERLDEFLVKFKKKMFEWGSLQSIFEKTQKELSTET